MDNTHDFPYLFSFFETVCMWGLCNHLAENKGAEGGTQTKGSLARITASEVLLVSFKLCLYYYALGVLRLFHIISLI